MKLRKINQNHKGYTLIELLVVMTIMLGLVSVIGISLSIRPSTMAKTAASDLNALLTRCKQATLTKQGDSYLVISKQGGLLVADYYESGFHVVKEELATTDVTLTYGGTALGSSPLYLAYNRNTGGFKTLTQAANGASGAVTGGYCNYVSFSGSGTVRTVVMPSQTGAHYIMEGPYAVDTSLPSGLDKVSIEFAES
ncbi:MAG: type II secretion system protein [Eubacteriales bacterium]